MGPVGRVLWFLMAAGLTASVNCPLSNAEEGRSMETKPDYARLYLKADHHARDSFSLTMQAVARLYGQDIDYETVHALSCNGFAPAVWPAKPNCETYVRNRGGDRCLDIVAARLGLEALQVKLPPEPPPPKAEPDGRIWGTPRADRWLSDRLKAIAQRIRPILAEGGVVVTDGALNPLPYHWGIIIEAREDGTVIGQTQDGTLSRMHSTYSSFWSLRPSRSPKPPEEADVAMLRRAVGRIRGDREPFLPGEIIFGMAAMDYWITQMQMPSFQEDDPGSSAGNASICALYSSEGAKDVASYLLRRVVTFPDGARKGIGAAAERYEHIWRQLSPFSTYHPEAGYALIMGNQAKQKQQALQVLVPCKKAMAEAADYIEAALGAIDGAGEMSR